MYSICSLSKIVFFLLLFSFNQNTKINYRLHLLKEEEKQVSTGNVSLRVFMIKYANDMRKHSLCVFFVIFFLTIYLFQILLDILFAALFRMNIFNVD